MVQDNNLYINLDSSSINGSSEDIRDQELIPIKKQSPNGSLREGDRSQLRSYNKWSPTEQGATLVWRDICVYSTKNSNLKRIINNVSGAVQPGTLVALMGSSGAGKSTLMSALAYRNSIGTIVQGTVLVNGQHIGPFMYRLSGFVHQDEIFLGTLTVFEHLSFMAELKLDRRVKKSSKRRIILETLEKTGLSRCANTRIGEIGEGKMLSGGEKKRLAFATELLIKPAILFCDEPTTGLDSFSAQQLVNTLQGLAKAGTAIICTIHQPSSQLFAMFDQVLMLAEGRVAFMGTPDSALEFFKINGYECPENYNPADFLIGVLASTPGYEKSSQRSVNRICDFFTVSEQSQQLDMLINFEMHMCETGDFQVKDEERLFDKPFWIVTMYWLTYRTLLTVIRDPTVQAMRMLQKIAIAIMAGLCFTGTIDLTQPGVQAIQGILFIFVSENTFSPMYSVLALFPQSFPLFFRERKNGLYNTSQYYLAHLFALLPGLILEPLVFIIIAYWLAALRPTIYAFLITTIACILVMNVSTACGCMFSAAFNSVPLAMAYLVPFDYVLMITSGVFVKLGSLPAILGWMPYISWMMYANEAMSIAQWQGITNITCYQVRENLPCLTEGVDVLDKYSFSEDHLHRNLWLMLFLYFIFHFVGYICLWRRTIKS